MSYLFIPTRRIQFSWPDASIGEDVWNQDFHAQQKKRKDCFFRSGEQTDTTSQIKSMHTQEYILLPNIYDKEIIRQDYKETWDDHGT